VIGRLRAAPGRNTLVRTRRRAWPNPGGTDPAPRDPIPIGKGEHIMATAQPLYHAPTFEPTVDEIATLKQLEMGQAIAVPDALKHHLSGRLLEWGYIGKSPAGIFHITDTGRKLIKRQDN
jgi:hypothetical protein